MSDSKAIKALVLARKSDEFRKRAYMASLHAAEAMENGSPHAEDMAWEYLRLQKLADQADTEAHDAYMDAERSRE